MRRLRVAKNSTLSTPETFGGVNYLVFGAPGSGKTRYFLEPALLQMNEYSHIIVDIKGSLYHRLGDKLRNNGYDVQCFDFINFDKDSFNPIEFVNTEEDAIALAKVIIGDVHSNSDPYWNNAATDLLAGLIGYAAEFPSHKFSYRYAQNRLYPKGDCNDYLGDSKLNLALVMKLLPEIQMLMKINGNQVSVLYQRFFMAGQHDMDWWPLRHIRNYIHLAEKTLSCIVNTINAALSIYCSTSVANKMKDNDFRPEIMGKRKQAIFITLKDYDDSLHQVAALMINQAVNTLIQEAGNDRLDVPVQIWMDDCGSYVIPELVQYLSCCRSRDIGFTMLCQSEHQLMVGYGDCAEETIVQCANTYIYMGGADATSAKRIAKRGNVMESSVLSMDMHKMYIMTQGQKLKLVNKLDESSKRLLEREYVHEFPGNEDYVL